MSERLIREAIAELIADTFITQQAPPIHAYSLEIRSEQDAIDLLGAGETDDDGKTKLHGWVVMRAKTTGPKWLTARGGMKLQTHAFSIYGYRSRSDGEEELAEAEAETIASALRAASRTVLAGAFYDSDGDEPSRDPARPAQLAGLSVWETQITLNLSEYL